jgi:hypothetical protein
LGPCKRTRRRTKKEDAISMNESISEHFDECVREAEKIAKRNHLYSGYGSCIAIVEIAMFLYEKNAY